jgi:hypothetical protein
MGTFFLSLAALLAVAVGDAEVTVTVRTVDRDAMPLPGVEVTVQEIDGCGRDRQVSGPIKNGTTEREGSAVFHLANGKSYLIRTDHAGGLEGREMCLPIRSGTDVNRYLQFQLRPDPRNAITIIEPSVGPVRPMPRRLVLAAFTGVYIDRSNQAYEVNLSDDTKGLTVKFSDGKVMTFSKRVGNVFTGPDGGVEFAVTGSRVTGLSLTPAITRAKRLEEHK